MNIYQIKADAYALGRADERLDARAYVERVTELALARNAPFRETAVPGRPRAVQLQSSPRPPHVAAPFNYLEPVSQSPGRRVRPESSTAAASNGQQAEPKEKSKRQRKKEMEVVKWVGSPAHSIRLSPVASSSGQKREAKWKPSIHRNMA